LAEEALVVRSGIAASISCWIYIGMHPSGVYGFSVECCTCSFPKLGAGVRNKQFNVGTAGAVRDAGGDVIK